MAIRKTYGVETEFGIIHRGVADSNPITASTLLINAYLLDLSSTAGSGRVGWDFEDESPANDARGTAAAYGSLAPEVETHLVNAVLTNGARYYVDHAHPELSTPECADPLDVVLYDRAGELIVQRSMASAHRLLPPGQELIAYKNNSDGKGNSYGCHENYLLDRAVPFGRIVTHATAHFVSRQIFTGAGKVGSEAAGLTTREVPFQLTQRADFFEEEVGLETTLKRPIINTRDEPHADPFRFRRLHVIVGDANLAQLSTFLKVATTAWVLTLVEDDAIDRVWAFAAPVAAMRAVSYDLSLARPLTLADGTTATALEIQWDLYRQCRAYADARGTDAVGPSGGLALDRWESVLAALESDPMSLAGQLDWVAKYRLFDAYATRHGLDWGDARLAAMDLQYHDLRPDRSLFARLPIERLVDDTDAVRAISEAPVDTRAWFRGQCLASWPGSVVAANWDSVVLDVGSGSFRRIPMMDPLRGTEAIAGALFVDCPDPAELVRRLDS